MDRRPSEMSEESGTSPARQADHSPQTSPRAGRHSVLSSVSGCPSDSENSWGQAPRRKLHAEFHKVEQKTKSGHLSEAESGWLRAKVAYVLDSDTLVNCMVVTILVDSVCALIDTDYRAMKLDVPVYSEVISITCLGIYTLELSALLWVNGASALKKKSILFDAFTLACGYLAISIRAFEAFGQPLPSDLTFLKDLRLLRMVRVMRVARVIQRTRWLKELKKLVSMMATCMKTLGWSFIFCFAFMTFWAMMVVEFVHPLVEQMQTERLLNCEECVRHTSSIMEANLLLFKTVIAGDSWGKIAVPVIQYSPATAIIFCGSLMTTVFGVLNMVIAVSCLATCIS
ncbi:Aurora kinase B-A [Durusdinium trenchii]|uniref:Aurora kinase B-A n=1 Tax=Durusdinium trenchii TaxID=1381693 RepID=A0ABP0PKA6_9DINO